jgi:2,3-bisphosphoglycerate-dependent phosphoglycerate mutase
MTIYLDLGNVSDEVGSPDFFHAFFSTISGNLEPAGWGTRFPALLRELYRGELTKAHAGTARTELAQIRTEMQSLPPDRVIWDFEDRSKRPPWGSNISPDITDLSNYFVTSAGRDLIEVIAECLDELQSGANGTLRVVSM